MTTPSQYCRQTILSPDKNAGIKNFLTEIRFLQESGLTFPVMGV